MIEPEKVFGNLITFYINLIVDGRAGRAIHCRQCVERPGHDLRHA